MSGAPAHRPTCPAAVGTPHVRHRRGSGASRGCREGSEGEEDSVSHTSGVVAGQRHTHPRRSAGVTVPNTSNVINAEGSYAPQIPRGGEENPNKRLIFMRGPWCYYLTTGLWRVPSTPAEQSYERLSPLIRLWCCVRPGIQLVSCLCETVQLALALAVAV